MERYQELSGTSGVTAYSIEPDAIDIQFVDGAVYTCTYASTGRQRVERMKRLARSGAGLSTYISREVRNDYAWRHQTWI